MKRLMVLTAVFVAALTSLAQACSCIRPGPPEQSLAQAGAVFRGRILRISKDTTQAWPKKIASVEVDTVWKGAVTTEAKVYTNGSSAACGYNFQAGKTYVFYAFLAGDKLSVSSCSRTRIADEEEAIALGPPTLRPLPVPAPLTEEECIASCPERIFVPLEERFRAASRAVDAEVLSVIQKPAPAAWGPGKVLWEHRLRVHRSWTQPSPKELTLRTPGQGLCKRKYVTGDRKIFFFAGGPDSVRLNYCHDPMQTALQEQSLSKLPLDLRSNYPTGWLSPTKPAR